MTEPEPHADSIVKPGVYGMPKLLIITGAIWTCLSETPKTFEMYPDSISLGVIPAEVIASFEAFSANSTILSSSLPYLVLPAPRTAN